MAAIRAHNEKRADAVKAAKARASAEKRAVLAALKDRPCTDCGGRFPAVAMDFDHVEGEKKFNVSRVGSFSLLRLLEEVKKCEVVCANCHRVRTAERKS